MLREKCLDIYVSNIHVGIRVRGLRRAFFPFAKLFEMDENGPIPCISQPDRQDFTARGGSSLARVSLRAGLGTFATPLGPSWALLHTALGPPSNFLGAPWECLGTPWDPLWTLKPARFPYEKLLFWRSPRPPGRSEMHPCLLHRGFLKRISLTTRIHDDPSTKHSQNITG